LNRKERNGGKKKMKKKSKKVAFATNLAIIAALLLSTAGVVSGEGFLSLPFQKDGISITQGWKYDAPINPDPKDPYKHEGIDYNLPKGTSVKAAADGVARSWYQYSGGYGYGEYVVIYHNNGYYTLYAHLESVNPNIVRLSQYNTDTTKWTSVGRGTEIGKSGQTGTSGGYHLHFEVFKGTYAVKDRKDPYNIYSTKEVYPPNGQMGPNHLWKTNPPIFITAFWEFNNPGDAEG
jgi:murein DD-endopeptidase MepM/ murein hydrolase activator NlpD